MGVQFRIACSYKLTPLACNYLIILIKSAFFALKFIWGLFFLDRLKFLLFADSSLPKRFITSFLKFIIIAP